MCESLMKKVIELYSKTLKIQINGQIYHVQGLKDPVL